MELPLADDELLRNVRLASPCRARWDDMAGDDRARFCSECQLHVYNLSALTTREAAALIREKEGRLCAIFYRRADGTLLTTDCPVGLRERLGRQVRRAGALMASLLAAFTSISCGDPNAHSQWGDSSRDPVPGQMLATPRESEGPPVQAATTRQTVDKKSSGR